MPSDRSSKEKLADLEKKILTREKVEEIAAASALDVLKVYESEVKKASQAAEELSRALEKREFARRVAASFEDRACSRSLDKLLVDMLSDEVGRAVEDKLGDALTARFENPEFAEKLKSNTAVTEEAFQRQCEISNELIERLDKMEEETLPQVTAKVLDEKLSEKLNVEVLHDKIVEVARKAVREIVNTPEFKGVLDEKFKVMMKYLADDVLPRQIRKITGS